MKTSVEVHPVTPDRWQDLEKLFGPNGAYGGCWCMFFRMRRTDWRKAKAEQNKAGMKALIEGGEPPGLLAYVGGQPAGWVAMDRREKYPHLIHSRALKLDITEPGVWSIVCFVVGKDFRRQGIQTALIDAAVNYARSQGAKVVEAYPIQPGEQLKRYEGYTGIVSSFLRAGFEETRRVEPQWAVVRKVL